MNDKSKNIVTATKKILTALGGNSTDYNVVAVIDKIANALATMAVAPAATEDDNGKVLGVYNGEVRWVYAGEIDPGDYTVYGFHIDSSISDPSNCITYLAKAEGKSPAYMDFDNNTWNYGDWENAFFMPKPCMLKYDGTVDYYLDPNDYSKKVDGTDSDVNNASYGGNAMMEWGRDGRQIWYKIVPNEADPTSADVYIANAQVDNDYHAWSFINNQGNLVSHFYTPIYNGSIDTAGRLRSISGIDYTGYCKEKTAEQEIIAAELNNPGEDKLWYTETFADIVLIQLLIVLITKSLDAQSTIGQGNCGLDRVGPAAMLITGTMNDKGLFYGTNSASGVKTFGMENFWGNQMRRFAGLVTDDRGNYAYKMTYGTNDGSIANSYNITGENYLSTDLYFNADDTEGFILKSTYNNNVLFPILGNNDSSLGYCGIAFTGESAYAYRGGNVFDPAEFSGLFCLNVFRPAVFSYWGVGAAPSCKPLS